MSWAEKAWVGVGLAAATTFGGVVYHNAMDRILAVEASTREIHVGVTEQQLSLAVIHSDILHLRELLVRVEVKLDRAIVLWAR